MMDYVSYLDRLFYGPKGKQSQQTVAETGSPIPEKKIERKITVTYVDKTILPDVFNDVDDVVYGDIWTRIRLKNRKHVVISNKQILRMDNEW